jgi:nitrile hydratase accessory protein
VTGSPPEESKTQPCWSPLTGDGHFEEPWQVELVAVALTLADAGWFTPADWAEALGAAIVAAQEAGDPDLGDTYHGHVLSALESLCAAKGLVPPSALDERTEAWRQAFLRTPHGQSVDLAG